MRKKAMLVCLVLASLLFAGCLGSSYVYDGKPAVLEVVIKRDNIQSLALNAIDYTQEQVHVRIWKENSAGEVIYDTVKVIPLNEITSEGYSLSEEVPSDKGYSIAAVYSDKKQHIEATKYSGVDVPFGRMTTVTTTLEPIDFEVIAPDVLFTGGSFNQFKVNLPAEYADMFDIGLRYRNLPWPTNTEPVNYTMLPTDKRMYTVHNPTTLYYQFVIRVKDEYRAMRPDPTVHIPNLDYESELPFVWAYPDPSWVE